MAHSQYAHEGEDIGYHRSMPVVLVALGPWCLAAVVVVVIWMVLSRRKTHAEHDSWKRSAGIEFAQVASFERTHRSVNDIPELRVIVELPDGSRYQKKVLVDPLHAIHVQPGAPAAVVSESGAPNRSEVFLDFEAETFWRETNLLGRLRTLGQLLATDGADATLTIDSARVLPFSFEGDGAMLWMTGSVRATETEFYRDRPESSGALWAAVTLDRVGRYQPGRVVRVRVSRVDPKKLALNES